MTHSNAALSAKWLNPAIWFCQQIGTWQSGMDGEKVGRLALGRLELGILACSPFKAMTYSTCAGHNKVMMALGVKTGGTH